LTDHTKELEQAKNHILEKEEVVLKLEENLSKYQTDLAERENKLNDFLQVEVQCNFYYYRIIIYLFFFTNFLC
jgi:multidrug resistance efflux pump